MKITLIGFMGAGKTSVAKLLAEKLSLERIDMDQQIIQKSGRKSDQEIFEKDGELVFRELEMSVAKSLMNKNDVIIAAGGGLVMNKINVDYLKHDGIIIYLKNSFATSRERIKHNPPPLFKNEQKAKELYDIRLPLYTYYADGIIETDNKTVEEISEEIIEKIKTL